MSGFGLAKTKDEGEAVLIDSYRLGSEARSESALKRLKSWLHGKIKQYSDYRIMKRSI
jgi:hypothetical protein